MEPNLPHDMRIEACSVIQWVEIESDGFSEIGNKFGAFVSPTWRVPTRNNQEWSVCSDVVVENEAGEWENFVLASDELYEVIEWEAYLQLKDVSV